MKTYQIIGIVSAVITLACNAPSQVFNSGSSGALGDVVVSGTNEWLMPDNGEFHLNSLVVLTNGVLTFIKPTNGLNPPVYLLSRSNVTIYGKISVDGQSAQQGGALSQGGPGGFAGGSFGNASVGKYPGDGYGPGHGTFYFGNATSGSFGNIGSPSGQSATNYGNLSLFPLIGGSGGGGCDSPNTGVSGGGGGGAILIASDTSVALINPVGVTNYGVVFARGGVSLVGNVCCPGNGSGGAIRIVAPSIVGNGTVDISGGWSTNCSSVYGGDGRARFDCRSKDGSIQVRGYRSPVWSVGRNPLIYPPSPAPRLDIIQAGGTSIPEGTNSIVFVTLPPGSNTAVITLQARNFMQPFQTWIDGTPESGPSWRMNFVWQPPPSVGTTNVTIPVTNSPTRIMVWADYSYRFNEH